MQCGKRALTCNATAEKALAGFDELNRPTFENLIRLQAALNARD